jgi:hypothetical protein
VVEISSSLKIPNPFSINAKSLVQIANSLIEEEAPNLGAELLAFQQ